MKLEVIIAPLVVFFVMVGLLVAARFYDQFPVKPPACGFKKVTGIPCVACRGTRSLRALADGQVGKAVAYNPLAVLGCLIAVVWLGGYVVRKGNPPRRSISIKAVAVITTLLLIGNWVYLILTNRWYP
ncbi:MAG: DUF2752 domain-containing protein [Verrucomicrobiales bacterium]|nr:DUF2752 domain-containing protein [Verrucomicrobiales bacterium]